MHRKLVLVIVLFAIGCASRSTTPVSAPVSPQVFQKQPFNNPWIKTWLNLRNSDVRQLAADARGNIWVADTYYLVRVSMRQGVKWFRVHSAADSIAYGSDKNLWIGDGRTTIARFTPTGQETDFTVFTPSGQFSDLTEGSDGALWFSIWTPDFGGMGRMDTAGDYTFYPVGYISSPISGPDGNLWFFDDFGNFDAMNTQGQIIVQYPATQGGFHSTIGPDGAMWFTTIGTTLVRATTNGQISTVEAPLAVNDIASYNGLLWLTSNTSDNHGNHGVLTSFDPRTQTFGAPIVSPFIGLGRIITGPDGNFWLTGLHGGVITYVNQVMSVSPTSLLLQSGGSGSLTIGETNYDGAWTAEWPVKLVNVVQSSPGEFTVTPVAPGTGKVTIQDSMHNYVKILVTVQ